MASSTIKMQGDSQVLFSGPRRRSNGDRNAGFKYAASCFLFAIVLTAAAIFNESNQLERIFYPCIMFVICSGPYFLAGRNLDHRLLVVFMACYFLIFVMSDFFDLLLGANTLGMFATPQTMRAVDGLTKSDWVVILGGGAFLAGYFLIYRLMGKKKSRFLVRDWKPGMVLGIALVCWVFGTTFSIAYNMVVTPMHIPTHVLGTPLGIASNFRLFSLLASLMFIYLIMQGYKPKLLWPLLILIILVEFTLGFIANSKEISYRIPALLLLSFYYLRDSINKKILFVTLLSIIPYLLFFNVYRMDVLMGAQNQTQVEAIESFDKNADVVMKNASKAKNIVATSLTSLKDRVNGKVYVDIIVVGTDSGRALFRGGDTLTLFFKSFVPRMFWPNKPNTSIGQLFNLEFHLSESRFTFVPSTQLGEFYWNFGIPGVLFGMLGIGMVFGYLTSVFSLRKALTLPRFMVLLLATYYLAIRFEANIAQQYSIFVRLVFLIVLVDVFIRLFGMYRRNPTVRVTG